jgi:hypothetical protein
MSARVMAVPGRVRRRIRRKKKHYAKSWITMTKDLCSIADWTAAEIAARQLAMADLAVKAWPTTPR